MYCSYVFACVWCTQTKEYAQQQCILHMFRTSSSSQTLIDGRNELPKLSESSNRGSPHSIPDVKEEQGDVHEHD
jgi:hypothetical protein